MKKVVAVIVSILWLGLVAGIPALVAFGLLDDLLPDLTPILSENDALLEQLDPLRDQLSQLGIELPSAAETPGLVDAPINTPEPPPTDTPEAPTNTPEPATNTPEVATDTPEPATPTPTAQDVEERGEITAPVPVAVIGRADLRSGPGEDSDVIGAVDAGAIVQIVAQDETGEWYQLEDGNWISASALAVVPSVPIAATVSPLPDTPTPEPVVETPPTATPAPFEPVLVTVNADANLRSGPGADFERVGGADFGTQVLVVGRFTGGEWYLLDDDSWIFASLIDGVVDAPEVDADGNPVSAGTAPDATAPDPSPAEPAPGSVTATTNVLANLRSGPGTTFDVVGSAPEGSTVVLVAQNEAGDWFKIEDGSWIFGELLTEPPQNLPVESEAVGAAGAVTAAEATEDTAETEAGTETSAAEADPGEAPAAAESESVDDGTGEAANAESNATAASNANLRSGPGVDFEVVDAVQEGAALQVIGRNEAGDWLQLLGGSWISAELVSGAPADLPVIEGESVG